ncbi:MAG: hypothetical protein EBY89_03355, partial [Actinobacteria bacterium]|nr:hypothetical protein [Actinomycetota bacterium]
AIIVTRPSGQARRLIELLESGPAAGAIAAASLGARDQRSQLLAFDMGGTTAKLSLIEAGQPAIAYGFEAARRKRFAEGSGLPTRDVDAHATHFVVFSLGERFIVAHLVDLDDHLVAAGVVRDADGADDELDVEWGGHLHRIVERSFLHVRSIRKELADVLRQCCNLLLLALHGDVTTLAADLQIEGAAARFADGGGREGVHVVRFEIRAHDGRRSFREPPVRLTPSTTGPEEEY